MAGEHGGDNVMSGAAGNLVQARSIGQVHFHGLRMPRPRQLPGGVGNLVNQKAVLGALGRAFAAQRDEDHPVIRVLRGQRGSGKSTVAVHWLHSCRDRFADGQLYANLGAYTDHATAPSEVLAGFLGALGVDRSQIPAGLEARENLFRSLTDGRSFQVLLDDAVTPAQVRSLLPGRGKSLVVVTGHGAFGELQQRNAELIDVEPLEDEMAVELLRGFAGDRIDAEPEARDVVVDMCAGLPAALCVVGRLLVAIPDLSLSELVDELADPEVGITRVTVGGEPSLGAVFDAGYRRLTELAQRCYRVIGLHPSGDDVSVAVLAAALEVPQRRLRPAIRELQVTRTAEQPEAGRLVMHKLVREHARLVSEAVDGAGQRGDIRRRMVGWYQAGAIAADHRLLPQRPWRARLFPDSTVDENHPAWAEPAGWMRAERVNLRAAVSLAFDLGELESVLRLCVAQWWLYESEKHSDDLLATHEFGLRAAEHLRAEPVKALLLMQQGYAHRTGGRFDEAITLCTEAARLAEAAGHVELMASALEGAGLAAFEQGDLTQARGLLQRNLALAEAIGDARRTALACLHGAKPEQADLALPLLRRAYEGFRSLTVPEPHNVAKVLLWQGRKLGDRERLDQALAIMTELDRQTDRADILVALGEVQAREDDAAEFYRRAVEIYEQKGQLMAALAVHRRLGASD